MLPALYSREFGEKTNRFFPRWCSAKFARNVDLSSKKFQRVFKSNVNCIDVDKTDYRYALVGYGNAGIVIYDTARNGSAITYPSVASIDRSTAGAHKFTIDCIQWYPHDTGMFMSLSADQSLKIWDTNELEVADRFSFTSDVYSFHMSEKAKRHSTIAVACKDKNIYMCDLKSGSKSHTLKGHMGAVFTVKWSPRNENILCSGSADGQVYMWDFRKVKSYLTRFTSDSEIGLNKGKVAHQGCVNGLCYLNDGLCLLSYGSDDILKLWDIIEEADTKVDYGHLANDARRTVQVAITKDLKDDLVYVPVGADIEIYEIKTGNYIKALNGHFMSVNCCSYNVAHQEMYSGSTDTQLLTWELPRIVNEYMDVFKDTWSDDDEIAPK